MNASSIPQLNRTAPYRTTVNSEITPTLLTVFEVTDLIPQICRDPYTLASLQKVNRQFRVLTSTNEALKKLHSQFKRDAGISTSVMIQNCNYIEYYSDRALNIRNHVITISLKRNMPFEANIEKLKDADLWAILPCFNSWIKASDTLIVWQKLANSIDTSGPGLTSLNSHDACIEKADQFSTWFKENEVNLGQLKNLNLHDNQLKTLPSEIGNLTQLQALYLYSNQLKTLPIEIGNLTQLQRLWLDQNYLQTLPTEIGNLRHLQKFWLYSNQLKTLPTEIGNLTQLQWLDLKQNQLQALPSEIGRLTQLQKLLLDDNQLQILPSEMAPLQSITHGISSLQIAQLKLYESICTIS